jgi:CheY-like chemotaxis protein
MLYDPYMRILILEDDAERHAKFRENLIGTHVVIVETAPEAIEKLQNESWGLLFLDHDLGGKVYCPSDENSGFHVAEWLSKNTDRQPKTIIIHSFNPDGADAMKAVLPRAFKIPGVWLAPIWWSTVNNPDNGLTDYLS